MNLIIGLLIGASFTILVSVLMWHLSTKKQQYQRVQKHLRHTLLERQVALAVDHELVYEEPRFLQVGPSSWNNLLLRAGLQPTLTFYGVLFVLSLSAALITGILTNGLVAIFCFFFVLVLSYFFFWMRAEKAKKRMIQQLPGFLESMVRLLTVGNSLASAFQNSVESVDTPLRTALDKVSALLYSGQNFDAALNTVANQYRLKELHLIASVIGVALQFGGRSDVVLERMAVFMRDLEQARMELHALSAEVRLSAWILSLMPLALAFAIMMMNSSLLVGMWEDSVGRYMLYLAIFLQTSGSFWLYRMTKSI